MCPKKEAAMRGLRISMLMLVTCLAADTFAAGEPARRPPGVLFIMGDSASVAVAKGLREFEQRHPEAAAAMAVELVSESHVGELQGRELGTVRVMLVDSHSQSRSEKLEKEFKAALIRSIAARGKVFALGEGAEPRRALTGLGADYDERVRAYWGQTGENSHNVYGMLCLLATAQFGQKLAVPPPQINPRQGYYHPAAPAPHWFGRFEEYQAWHTASRRSLPGRPWVAVPFYGSNLFQEQTGLLDAVIAEAERQRLNVLPVFGYPEKNLWDELLTDAQGRSRVQAALAFTFRFAGPEMQTPLLKADIPVFNMIKIYARSEQEWRESKTGLSMFENVFQIAIPELSGVVAPIVVGTEERRFDPLLKADVVVAQPLPERVRMAVKRLQRYLTLQTKPNASKRLALVYYNYPPGKANIGASYLNTLRSIATVLQRLKAEGYDVGTGPLTEEEVTRRALAGGRNVGSFAPGELQAMVVNGQVARVPSHRYQQWFDALPPDYRAQVSKDWGEPDAGEGMWIAGDKGLDMVVPVAKYGNIAVLPQPDRGFGQALEKLYHSMDTTPPHHYAGVYRWLRDEWRADAVVHVGTHGTLEWLGGKEMGLTESDAPDVMLDELPDIYLYNVDVVGEGLVAKRRGMASIVDHMIPPLRKGGLYGEYARISELASDYESAIHKSPNLAAGIEKELRQRLGKLGLLKDLGMEDTNRAFTHDDSHRIEDYFAEMKNKNMPYGLHTFGTVPEAALRASTLEAIMEPERGWNPIRKAALRKDLDARIQASGPRELDQMIRALNGRYIAPGTGNDPVRNPDSLPTGKNFYGIDPSKVPKRAAWELGVKLADGMLKEHLRRDGRYPQKVAFVIWGTETLRHEGVSESQFFHLLGTRPVWDERGKVIDVEVIPRAKLGRPRIDVVISSAAEGMFGQLTELMDKAVQKINLLEEPDNYAREHTLLNAQRLKEKGYDDSEALRRASIRIFDEPPGQYNLNVARITQNSGSWDKESAITNDYFQKMGHGFGNGSWGENMEDAFRLTLSGTEKIIHSRSSNLYGTLDNDDFFMYAGGLAQAVRELDGKSPDLMVAELQTVGRERLSPIAKVMGMEFRNRSTNPLWIQGMMKEGYAGAHEMRSHLENLWGWQVTVPEAVGEAKWTESYETYVLDKNQLGLEAWFEENSPYARQEMVARLLETVRKGRWSPSPEVRAKLVTEYVKSAKAHGFSCSALICQNPALAQYTIDQGRIAGLPETDLKAFQERLEQATRKSLGNAAQEMQQFIATTEQAHAKRAADVKTGMRARANQLKGFVMEKRDAAKARAKPLMQAASDHYGQLLTTAALLLLAVGGWWGFRYRNRNSADHEEGP
jgi:cobaltochelatase CobN